MRVFTIIAAVAVFVGCSDQGPRGSVVMLPATVGPATDRLEVWAEIADTNVSIQDSIVIDIHVRNPTASSVGITSACVSLMYVTALRGGEELGLDGSGACLTAVTEHWFAAGEEKIIRQRAWARWNGNHQRGDYVLRIGTHAYAGIPEPEAPFSIR